MDKTVIMVCNFGCGFKEKGQDVSCTTSERKNGVLTSVTLYFISPFELKTLKFFELETF